MELSADQSRRLLEMLDRQEILDCIHRYCRGMDRLDRENGGREPRPAFPCSMSHLPRSSPNAAITGAGSKYSLYSTRRPLRARARRQY